MANRPKKWIENNGICESCGRDGSHYCTGSDPGKRGFMDRLVKQVQGKLSGQEVPPVDNQEKREDNIPKMQESNVIPAVEKRPPTKPWTQEGNPWKRDTLRLKGRHPGFRPRWVDPRNFERNLEDGWSFADKKDYGDVYDKIVGEEKQLDSRIRRRGMVLMEIPEGLAKKREEYYEDRAKKAERSIKERHKKDAQEAGVDIYDPVA